MVRDTREFEELMSRVFDVDPFMMGRWPVGGYNVPVDVLATEDKVVVRLEAAGVKADDLDVSFHDDVLVVSGTRKFPWGADEVRFLRRGIFYGEFTRHIALPKGLNRDDVEAHYEDGILELTIPVSEEVKPKRISIGTGRKAITS
jgi:HSP20 family protein